MLLTLPSDVLMLTPVQPVAFIPVHVVILDTPIQMHDLEAMPQFVGPTEGSRHAGESSSPGKTLPGALSYRGFSTRGR